MSATSPYESFSGLATRYLFPPASGRLSSASICATAKSRTSTQKGTRATGSSFPLATLHNAAFDSFKSASLETGWQTGPNVIGRHSETMSRHGARSLTNFHAFSSANFLEPRCATTALVPFPTDSSYESGLQSSAVYVNRGGAFRVTSMTDANEEVTTTLFTLGIAAVASNTAFTPAIAGRRSFFPF